LRQKFVDAVSRGRVQAHQRINTSVKYASGSISWAMQVATTV
jgi:hypothetical protein